MSRHHYGARLHRFTDDLGYRRVALENEQALAYAGLRSVDGVTREGVVTGDES